MILFLISFFGSYANNESYKKAIEDFEDAFASNPRHQNARKYLCQTLVAQGKM